MLRQAVAFTMCARACAPRFTVNPFATKDKGGRGEYKAAEEAAAASASDAAASIEVFKKAQSVQEIEQEIMLRDTFELFDVEERGGLDEHLMSLLLKQLGIPFTDDEIHEVRVVADVLLKGCVALVTCVVVALCWLRQAFQNLDEDHNGYVECQEFINFFKRTTAEVKDKEVCRN